MSNIYVPKLEKLTIMLIEIFKKNDIFLIFYFQTVLFIEKCLNYVGTIIKYENLTRLLVTF